MRRHIAFQAALVTTLIFGLQVPAAHAVLTLTPAGSGAGFSLSTFATGFPSSSSVGPLGIAFPGSGVLVTDYPGNVRLFASDTDGQTAAGAPIGQNYGLSNAVGLAQVGSHFYMAQQGNAQVVEVNANGALNQVILTGATGIGFATGIVANPANGHLFVSNVSQIFDVDPIAKTRTLFVSAAADGLTISSDGSILYGAVGGHILGFNTTTKTQVFDSGAIAGGLDGTALGFGSLAGNIFGNTNGGTVVEVNLTTLAQTLLATSGSRGDFVSVDPNNNTLLLTQTDSIVRLIAPTGGGFGGPTVPEPSTWLLLASGLAGIYALRCRKQM